METSPGFLLRAARLHHGGDDSRANASGCRPRGGTRNQEPVRAYAFRDRRPYARRRPHGSHRIHQLFHGARKADPERNEMMGAGLSTPVRAAAIIIMGVCTMNND